MENIEPESWPLLSPWLFSDRERHSYEYGFFMGHAVGSAAAKDQIARLNWEADRLYTEMCRRKAVPFVDPNRKSHAELERIRREIYSTPMVQDRGAA